MFIRRVTTGKRKWATFCLLEMKPWAAETEDISINIHISQLRSYRTSCNRISISEHPCFDWWMLSLEPVYRNLWVVMLISSHHKQIKIDPRTTVPPNPNIGRVALHRSAEHHRGARLWLPLCSFSSRRCPWRKNVKPVKTSVNLRAAGLNPSIFIFRINTRWDCGRLRKFGLQTGEVFFFLWR